MATLSPGKTGLKHQLLSRNYRGLLVAASAADLNRLQSALPYLLPRRDTTRSAISPTVLILHPRASTPKMTNGMNSDSMAQAGKQFIAGFRTLLDERGFQDSRIVVVERASQASCDAEVGHQVSRNDHGLILIPRNPEEPWRNKAAFDARGKIIVLMGTRHRRISRVLVPIDMSISSMLVMMFFHQAFGWRTDMEPRFVHVQSEPTRAVAKRWRAMKRLVGLEKNTPLQHLAQRNTVADVLIDYYKTEGLDAIIMGRRGISRMKYLLLGSVSAAMVRRLDEDTIILVD